MYPVTLIPGDGTGPEISEATKRVIEATGVPIKWDIQEAGLDVYEREGTPLPQRVIDSIKKNKIAIIPSPLRWEQGSEASMSHSGRSSISTAA
jgi:isocitrate dehydrogenase (NAD+)